MRAGRGRGAATRRERTPTASTASLAEWSEGLLRPEGCRIDPALRRWRFAEKKNQGNLSPLGLSPAVTTFGVVTGKSGDNRAGCHRKIW